MLKDWQGVPPTRTSAGAIRRRGRARIDVKSPAFGTSGYLRASTARGNGSISATSTHSQPSGVQATDAASMPEHTERKRIGAHSHTRAHARRRDLNAPAA